MTHKMPVNLIIHILVYSNQTYTQLFTYIIKVVLLFLVQNPQTFETPSMYCDVYFSEKNKFNLLELKFALPFF